VGDDANPIDDAEPRDERRNPLGVPRDPRALVYTFSPRLTFLTQRGQSRAR